MYLLKIIILFACILLYMFTSIVTANHNTSFDIPIELQHLDIHMVNNYIAAMIKTKQPDMKAALLKEKHINDFQLRDAKFDITTGQLLIKFKILYKKTDIQGALRFEIRVSMDAANNGSPEFGGYCTGLEGRLQSSKFFANIALAFARNAINKRLVGREFWRDGHIHNQFIVFKNDNLAQIVNLVFIEGDAGHQLFKKIAAPFPGGQLEAELKNIRCQRLDVSTGQTQISFDMDAAVKPDLGFEIQLNNVGSAVADFDLYIHSIDQSWWVKLNSFKFTFRCLPSQVNLWLQNIINKELNNRKILLRIDMPQINQVESQMSKSNDCFYPAINPISRVYRSLIVNQVI